MQNKLFVKNLSNKNPTKILLLMILEQNTKITTKKKIIIKVNKNIIFSPKKYPIIAGLNGSKAKLIFKVAKFYEKKE